MPVSAHLARLSSWTSLERLFAALDVRGPWHQLDAEALEAGPGIRRMATLAVPQSLPWIILVAREARLAARTVARARAALGAPAGIACLDPAARNLVLTVSLANAPQLEVSLERPDPVAVAVLDRIPALKGLGALEGAATLAEWLAVEPVGTRFFRQFRLTFEQMQAALPAGPRADERAALALLQLTRMLFLYFIQSKGWLGGRGDFLASAVDDALRRKQHLHRDLLRPLWFGTLNRPPADRGPAARRFGHVLFLNGGLFEAHPLERRWKADIPTATWREAFDGLFERFQFVTREADGAAIGPDTLGRVFEGLMEPELRHRSGSYYTPAPLVRRILLAGFSALVAQRTGQSLAVAEGMLDRRDGTARAVLSDIAVLDPAAGSGAFLLGALELLADLTRRDSETTAAARRRVVASNLFGVDVNPAAVRLAELRLWLAVIAEEASGESVPVAPLPNLDAVVRQGDSLWDRLGARIRPDAATATLVRHARHAVVAASGSGKRRALASLRHAEEQAGREALVSAVDARDLRIRERLEAARSLSLFGERRGMGRADAAWLAAARRDRRRLREAIRRLERTGQLDHFDYAVHFADVLARGGFDLVAGNPPWVRGEAVPADLRQSLRERYRWYRPVAGAGYRNAADLAVAFIERGLELTRDDGVLAFLVPSKIRHAGYAESLRAGLAAGCTLHMVAEVSQAEAQAFGATVYPMALVASRARAAPDHRVRTALDAPGNTVPQSALQSTGPWILTGDVARRAAHRLLGLHPRIGEHWRVQLGVKTGADDVFLTREPDIEAALLRRAVRGRDLTASGPRSVLWLRWPCDARGAPLASLPPRAAAWYRLHADRLKRRADYRDGPAWRLFRTRAAVAPHRVIWADLSRRLTAVPLIGPERAPLIPLNTCYLVSVESAARAALVAQLLNSTWHRALAAQMAPVAAGGFFRFSARVIEALPCPRVALEQQDAGAAHLAELSPSASDQQVADWLQLTADERHALADLSQARR